MLARSQDAQPLQCNLACVDSLYCCASDGKLSACRNAHSHLARQGLCSGSRGEETPGRANAGVQAGGTEGNMAAWA